MKKYLLLLFVLLFALACSQKKKPLAEENQKQYQPPANQNEKLENSDEDNLKPFSVKKVFNLKPNLKIKITENHPDGFWGICDLEINITSDSDSRKFNIADSDPMDTSYVADLNKDNNDELYILLRSSGSGGFSSLLGYTIDSVGKIQQIDFGEIAKYFNSDEQYGGKDNFYFSGNLLVHEYPLYNDGDANCCPSGGSRMNYFELINREGKLHFSRIYSKMKPPSAD